MGASRDEEKVGGGVEQGAQQSLVLTCPGVADVGGQEDEHDPHQDVDQGVIGAQDGADDVDAANLENDVDKEHFLGSEPPIHRPNKSCHVR